MRTLATLVLVLFCLGCHAQVDTSFKQSPYLSVSGRYFLFGESPFEIERTTHITIKKSLLTLNTGEKISTWPMIFDSEVEKEPEDDDDLPMVMDTYKSRGNTEIKLIYEDKELVDVVVVQGLISYHFYITYPKSL